MQGGIMGTATTEAVASSDPISFEFTGKASEYFSIWIVNILLTILTLGIYSAWAKVRTNQYFYGNTHLDGNTFRYLADPKKILKGRIIAVIIFAAYYFSGLISPFISLVALGVIMLLMPAFLVMSMSFQLRNSAYKNIRFNFEKNFKGAYKIFVIPLLVIGGYIGVITLLQPDQLAAQQEIPETLLATVVGFILVIFLMFPWWEYMFNRFKVDHADFGTSDFSFTAKKRAFYFLYLKALLGIILVGILFSVVFGGLIGAMTVMGAGKEGAAEAAVSPMLTIALSLMMIIPYLWFFAYIQTKKVNLVFSHIKLEGHQVTSKLTVGYMMYLYATNTLAMAVSLGLLMPWARIRTARYRVSMTAIEPAGDFNGFIAAQSKQQSALGEEMGEMFDMDLGM
ncbi:hypothetical protein MNBD_GAMMA15-830 [hydrothermal vent metagenome]|uniref:Uncharacterized protein n=1 Tax=hydrothermal vent metagenome TaxID=652676 RepID=A0A3B0Y508_9ZZZZ